MGNELVTIDTSVTSLELVDETFEEVFDGLVGCLGDLFTLRESLVGIEDFTSVEHLGWVINYCANCGGAL